MYARMCREYDNKSVPVEDNPIQFRQAFSKEAPEDLSDSTSGSEHDFGSDAEFTEQDEQKLKECLNMDLDLDTRRKKVPFDTRSDKNKKNKFKKTAIQKVKSGALDPLTGKITTLSERKRNDPMERAKRRSMRKLVRTFVEVESDDSDSDSGCDSDDVIITVESSSGSGSEADSDYDSDSSECDVIVES